MKNGLPYPPPFQDLSTLAAHVCMGESTIEEKVRLGEFPAPRKVGGKRLWSWKEVERFLSADDNGPTQLGSIRDATRRVSQGG